MNSPHLDIASRLEALTRLSVELSTQRDVDLLLERILRTAKSVTLADAGTFYRIAQNENSLALHLAFNDTLEMGDGSAQDSKPRVLDIPNISLVNEDGSQNLSAIAAYAANTRRSVNIADVYRANEFNFSGIGLFDQTYGYRSQSILTVPMQDHEGELIGVLQLVNAIDPGSGDPHPFSATDQRFIEALASQAAVAISQQQLIDRLESLFEHFIGLINIGIDEKSPHTGRHCEHVPELAMLLAQAAHDIDSGPLADFRMTDRDRRELWIAGLLHDCGKIATPDHIVEKSTKLETIYDRINTVDTRFEVLKRDAEIVMLKRKHAFGAALRAEDIAHLDARLQRELHALEDDRDFLRHCNIGGEGMHKSAQERVLRIAERIWKAPDGQMNKLLSSEETENLCIRAGTLNAAERQVINHHIVVTIKMLEALPWPSELRNVPEYAGGHHERMDGKGYPKGLTGDQMSLQARMMAIADIFEALTAADRPYKKGNSLAEALELLGGFCVRGHIDPDLFDVFVRSKVYETYAQRFMDPDQIDAVDLERIPGYTPLKVG